MCFVVLLAVLLPVGTESLAANVYEPLTVTLPYRHCYTTMDVTADSLFHYVISAEAGAPLPAEADEKGVFSVQGVSGGGEKVEAGTQFDQEGSLTFTFTSPGVYAYEIQAALELDGSKPNAANYTFEQNVLTVRLYIVNDSSNGMALRMLTAEDGDGVKPQELCLDPTYAGPTGAEEQPDPTSSPAPAASPKPAASPQPTDAPSAGNAAGPRTGDDSAVALWAALFALSGAALIVALILPGKKKGREDNA